VTGEGKARQRFSTPEALKTSLAHHYVRPSLTSEAGVRVVAQPCDVQKGDVPEDDAEEQSLEPWP
jgi:metal-dependent HD superfamily phosphatase/phosphodiesterase